MALGRNRHRATTLVMAPEDDAMLIGVRAD